MPKVNTEKWDREVDRAINGVLHGLFPQLETKAEQAADFLGRSSVNQSKDPGRSDTWTDRTTNLRKSISHVVKKEGRKSVATVFAGMRYGLFVHIRDGYRVLLPPAKEDEGRLDRVLKLRRS